MAIKIFRKCGFFPFLLLVLILFFLAGCIDKSANLADVPPDVQQEAYQDTPLRAEVDFDSQVSDSLFRTWGSLILWGNGSLPYVMFNATLWKESQLVTSARYMMIDVQGNGNYAFEIAKNLRFYPGDYSCTLEIAGPKGPLLCQSRDCQTSSPFETGLASLKDRLKPPGLVGTFPVNVLASAEDKTHEIEYPSSYSESLSRSFATAEEKSAEKLGEAPSNNAEQAEETIESKSDGDELESSRDRQAAEIETGEIDNRSLLGSTSSNKYHRSDCRYAAKIKPENRIYFSSSEEARKKGYEPCKSCCPS